MRTIFNKITMRVRWKTKMKMKMKAASGGRWLASDVKARHKAQIPRRSAHSQPLRILMAALFELLTLLVR